MTKHRVGGENIKFWSVVSCKKMQCGWIEYFGLK